MANYDHIFFDYVNQGSVRSAEQVLPHLTNHIEVASVLDVGCGQGAWLNIWEKLGVSDIVGIDGDYVDRSRLLFDKENFLAVNLENEFDLGRKFDIVQSLEVAEHIPESSASTFVASLVKHGELVFFSAAAKGQGGDNHVNEQDYRYWQKLFARHGYVPVDYVRPLIQRECDVEPWYRYNVFLFGTEARIGRLAECIQSRKIPAGSNLPDISPIHYKLRKLFVRLLPVSLVTSLSKIRQRWIIHASETK